MELIGNIFCKIFLIELLQVVLPEESFNFWGATPIIILLPVYFYFFLSAGIAAVAVIKDLRGSYSRYKELANASKMYRYSFWVAVLLIYCVSLIEAMSQILNRSSSESIIFSSIMKIVERFREEELALETELQERKFSELCESAQYEPIVWLKDSNFESYCQMTGCKPTRQRWLYWAIEINGMSEKDALDLVK